jgi:predicted permease
VRGLPGVESAALARVAPMGVRGYSSAAIAVDGYQAAPDERPTAEFDEVSPDYFRVLGIPLEDGREFTAADRETAPLVAVVNQTMARRYWRGRNPVGQRLQSSGQWLEIVGVARDIKYKSYLEPSRAFFYVPLRQAFSGQVMLHLRTTQAPDALAPGLAQAVHALDPTLAPSAVSSMQEQIETSSSTQRIAVLLLGVFGGLALLLAAVGLYGVMSYSVSESRREIGLRMALGATSADLLRIVVGRGLGVAAGGVILGMLGGLAMTGLVADLLYRVSPRDPVTFLTAAGILLIVSAGACVAPAWRAVRVDPLKALCGD